MTPEGCEIFYQTLEGVEGWRLLTVPKAGEDLKKIKVLIEGTNKNPFEEALALGGILKYRSEKPHEDPRAPSLVFTGSATIGSRTRMQVEYFDANAVLPSA